MAPLIARRPLDCLLYHQYLKGQPSTESLVSSPALSVDEIHTTTENVPSFHWDLRETNKHLTPAFDFISQKLAEENLSIHLIISDHSPFVIPVWPLPRKSQVELARIVRKACSRFNVKDSWMAALGSMSKKEMTRAFEKYKPDSYVVRRSIVQHEVVYGQEGLTLLSIDHIHTLKQILCTLTKPNWVSQQARRVCLASCVELLHRIHSIYTGKPVTKSYIARVYEDIPFQADCLDEVCAIYDTTHCTATIHDVACQPDFSAIVLEDPFELDGSQSPASELPERNSSLAVHPALRAHPSNASGDDDLVSPLVEVDLSGVQALELLRNGCGAERTPPINALEISYPIIKRPSSSEMAQVPSEPELSRSNSRVTLRGQRFSFSTDDGSELCLEDEVPETALCLEGNEPEAADFDQDEALSAPMPLKISKSSSAIDQDRDLVSIPPSASSTPPSNRPQVSVPPLLPTTAFNDEVESAIDAATKPLPPPYQQNDHLPLQYPENEEMMKEEEEEADEVHTILNLHHLNGGHSNHFDLKEEIAQLERRGTWQSDDVLEDPAAYIQSWSSGVILECPILDEPLPPPPTTAMLVGDVKCF